MCVVHNPYKGLAAPYHRKRSASRLFRFLALSGMIAFLFSVLSADDDLFQQDFARKPKFVHSLVAGSKGFRCSLVRGKSPTAILLQLLLSVSGNCTELDNSLLARLVPVETLTSLGNRAPPSVQN